MHHNKKCVKIISYKMVFRSFNKFIMRYINNSFKNRKKKKNFKKRKKRFLKAKKRINLFFRRLSILIFILGMISLIISGGIFILNKIFSVKSIECNETEMYSCSEIVNASGIKIGDKILFLNNALAYSGSKYLIGAFILKYIVLSLGSILKSDISLDLFAYSKAS